MNQSVCPPNPASAGTAAPFGNPANVPPAYVVEPVPLMRTISDADVNVPDGDGSDSVATPDPRSIAPLVTSTWLYCVPARGPVIWAWSVPPVKTRPPETVSLPGLDPGASVDP